MADKKISELVSLAGKDVAATDFFPVVDVSVAETKSLTRDELRNAVNAIHFTATKALATTAAASLPDDTIIEVAADESLSGARTRYTVAAGALVFAYGVVTQGELDAVAGAVYLVEAFRQAGDSDSEVINKALRKIELDALPGSRLKFECGRTYTYDTTHSLGYINDLEIDLNGALLKRANASAVSTTLAADLDTTGVPGRTMVLTSIPANWQVTDLVAAVVGTGNDGASSTRRITAINRATNTVTLNFQLDGYTGASTYPAGTVIAKSFNCFSGRPSAADSSTLLTPGANKRIRIHGGTIDGNEENQISYSWRLNSEIILHSEGGAIYDVLIKNTAAESITGHGMTVSGCTFLDLGGSALHTSVNDFLADVATPTIFTGNVVRRTNLKGQIASGHAEGAITFSWGPGHLIVTNNLFDGGNEPLLGAFGVSSGANASRLLIVSGNICKGYLRIFASVQANTYGVTITGNSFHDCGDNTALTSALYNRLNRISGNSVSGNTVLQEQDQLVSQRFGPTVIETVGGAGPAVEFNTLNRLWLRQGVSGVPAANLADANQVLESSGNNLLTFANVATKYAGIVFRVAGTTNPVGYFTHDPVTNVMAIGPSQGAAELHLKSGNHTTQIKLKADGATEFVRRDKAIYIGDSNTDGSWHIDASGTDLIFRRRVAGSWVVKQAIAGA